MRALVSASTRFLRTPDAVLWNKGVHGYAYWQRYLDVYDEVQLLVRTVDVEAPPQGAQRVCGPAVSGVPVPDFGSPRSLLARYAQVRAAVVGALGKGCAVHLRLPCLLGGIVWRHLPPGLPYGVEVTSDPYEVFAPGAFRGRLRPVYRPFLVSELRRQCAGAHAVLYVTSETLQRRYPAVGAALTVSAADVQLREKDLAPHPRTGGGPSATIVHIGTMAQLYKAPDVLLEAVARCTSRGLDLSLVLIGDGRFRGELEALAGRLGMADRVRFTGQLLPEAVTAELDAADLFVLPSLTEGLPRALIEAMARGLPCIGSTAGGIPELLEPDDLVPPGDAGALADAIEGFLTDAERMARSSLRNLRAARGFAGEAVHTRRLAFYREVRDATHAWRSVGVAA